uniref:PQLC2 n=1 Tax=Ascaris lumbricoides TaxID=6252 RepID=A0A0M3IJY8_ASCLU
MSADDVLSPVFRSVPLRRGVFELQLQDDLSEGNCTHGIKWILEVFAGCVDTNLKLCGFILGFVSLILWLLPLIPQLLQNYRTKKCEGLSIFFLLFWMVGDSCNMTGAILTNQQPIQKIIGVYYILQSYFSQRERISSSSFIASGCGVRMVGDSCNMTGAILTNQQPIQKIIGVYYILQDLLILGQYFYYTNMYPKRHLNENVSAVRPLLLPVVMLGVLGSGSVLSNIWSLDQSSSFTYSSPSVIRQRRLLVFGHDLGRAPIFHGPTDVVCHMYL